MARLESSVDQLRGNASQHRERGKSVFRPLFGGTKPPLLPTVVRLMAKFRVSQFRICLAPGSNDHCPERLKRTAAHIDCIRHYGCSMSAEVYSGVLCEIRNVQSIQCGRPRTADRGLKLDERHIGSVKSPSSVPNEVNDT